MSGRFWSGALTIFLVAVLGTLTALAYSSLPDPSWIRGMYDAADSDDVVVSLTSAFASVAPLVVSDLRPILVVIRIHEPKESPAPVVLVSAACPRSPPFGRFALAA